MNYHDVYQADTTQLKLEANCNPEMSFFKFANDG